MRTTFDIPDRLLISAPNGGGLLYAYHHLLIPLLHEDATGLAITGHGMLWCVQTVDEPMLREIRQGRLDVFSLGEDPLDLHDVLVDEESTYVVFTETNEVVQIDSARRAQQRWCFGSEPDSAHVNCVAMHNSRLIASMFGSFSTHRGYKGATRHAGKVVDVNTGETLIEGLSQPHSLVVVGDQLWLCSSEDRTLHIYDRHFALQRQVELPAYTRGLAVGENHVYVGLNRSRNLASGEAGQFDSAAVAVLERSSLQVLGFVPLPCNEVYDIRIAPSADLVNEVMTASWAFERDQVGQGTARLEQSLEDTRQSLRENEQTLQSERSINAHMQRELSATEAFRQSEVARLTQMLEHERQHHESRLAQVTGEVVKRDSRIHALEQVRAELAMVKASRSWRVTRPLRFATRLMQPPAPAAPPAELKPVSTQPSAPLAGPSLDKVALADRPDNQRDYFLWAVIDWHFRIQRPQHLARELAAAGHRVFYISNNFIDRPDPGFSVESLDSEGRLFQIHVHLVGSPAIYHATPDANALAQLRSGVGELLVWTQSCACASLVQHPYWLETAETLPNHRMVYDCMDHHGGFADNTDDVLEREKELMHDADLLVVTSDWLHDEVGQQNSQRMMVRNACQYEHFSIRPEQVFTDDSGRKVIGYYGAIAEWFDLDLIEKVATQFSDCLVLLVGADTSSAQKRLQALANVQFIGEVPYDRLPYYLHGFDVCLLPFQVIPLTLATNPVKVYEYLSAGKRVVSIALPEIRQFGDLVSIGNDHAGFIKAVGDALAADPDTDDVARRQVFAAEQTWAHRVQDLVRGIDALPQPRVSVVVVTYNNLDLTKACLHSLERYSDYSNLELIVVDNASADDTPNFLREWAAAGDDRQIILNDDNRGFAAANNQGLAAASGAYLVMLNNDTYVTPGWIATLVGHLRRSDDLGMLGPVTNNIGNEARIEIRYDSMEEMLPLAGDYTRRHAGQLTPLRTAAFFCVMLPRTVYEKVGLLDEAFGIGFFEDDDYCRRVEQAGWTVACADDVFVHHNLSASFNKLKQETRQALFEQNKTIYEKKWGPWVSHKYRGQ